MDYDTLCLSGGGLKGIYQLGALHYLYQESIYKYQNIKNFIGTSIGSVICLLLNIGMKPFEIFSKTLKSDVCLDIDIHKIMEFKKKYGLFDINKILNVAKDMILEKCGVIPTLLELYKLTNKRLIIVGTNATKLCAEYFDYESQPNMTCYDAILISCSLPFIFDRFIYNDNIYVDGGLADNFPIRKAMEYGDKIIGVTTNSDDRDDDDAISYAYKLLTIPLKEFEKLQISQIDHRKNLIISLKSDSAPFEIQDNKNKKYNMFKVGYTKCEEFYLESFEWF